MKCEYCRKEKDISLTKTSYLEISLDNKVNVCEKRKFDGKHWQVGTADFNYCPMCGRRLSDE
ncbi:hypothetical protein [Liquorilactobacillus mali]|uniref:hypothetical protein n=1 Tax=Liquorilactobacillus mali TaxID=1618 RepID=UPI002952D150|nr:hypothetical protein [Liquorilactobacillus mali]MDV7758242.1 hypothetical protein [Liquorilactobacillus mali]